MRPPELPIAVNTYSYTYSDTGVEAVCHFGKPGLANFELFFNSPDIWCPQLCQNLRKSPPALFKSDEVRMVSFNPPIMDHNITSSDPDIDLLEGWEKPCNYGWKGGP